MFDSFFELAPCSGVVCTDSEKDQNELFLVEMQPEDSEKDQNELFLVEMQPEHTTPEQGPSSKKLSNTSFKGLFHE